MRGNYLQTTNSQNYHYFLCVNYILQYLLNTMNYIEIDYQTWQREQCYGLFDYSEQNHNRHQKIIIKSAGTLMRNEIDYELQFIDHKDKKKKVQPEHCIPLLKIEESQGHFFVNNKGENNADPLCMIIPRNQKGYQLKENDKIRLGKAHIQILRIFWNKRKTKNHYEQISEPKIPERQSVFACSFYSQLEKASMVETNPACRLCYSKTIDQKNPFLAVCNCSGSTKYIHQECLIEWIKKRSGIENERLKEGVYYAYAKAFSCEVCHALYRMDRIVKKAFNLEGNILDQYVCFQINSDPPIIYVVDLVLLSEIQIGRSLENTIVINELSVSRKHCVIKIDKEKKNLTIIDLNAKFGTILQVQRAEIEDEEQYQKGRTKILFKKQRKVSFFQRIGFCSPMQNLRNYKKNS